MCITLVCVEPFIDALLLDRISGGTTTVNKLRAVFDSGMYYGKYAHDNDV